MQILSIGWGPIYLTVLMKCPILCYSSPRSGILLSTLHVPPHVCRQLALLSFGLMASWFNGLRGEENDCAARREALGAGSGH